jgi:hypothetical protein
MNRLIEAKIEETLSTNLKEVRLVTEFVAIITDSTELEVQTVLVDMLMTKKSISTAQGENSVYIFMKEYQADLQDQIDEIEDFEFNHTNIEF